MATLGSANPDDVGTVEVVEMLLEVTLASEFDQVAVKEAHGALILLEGGDVEARGGGHSNVGILGMGRCDGARRLEPRLSLREVRLSQL
jgi:hypothetical protein